MYSTHSAINLLENKQIFLITLREEIPVLFNITAFCALTRLTTKWAHQTQLSSGFHISIWKLWCMLWREYSLQSKKEILCSPFQKSTRFFPFQCYWPSNVLVPLITLLPISNCSPFPALSNSFWGQPGSLFCIPSNLPHIPFFGFMD